MGRHTGKSGSIVYRIILLILTMLLTLSASVPAYASGSDDSAVSSDEAVSGDTEDRGELRIAYMFDPGMLELDSRTGEGRGYIAEYLTNIAQRIDMKLEYVPCSSHDDQFSKLDSGEVDIIPDCYMTEKNEMNYLFSKYEIAPAYDADDVRPLYIVISRDNSGLKTMIDTAMGQITSENMLYEIQLYNKYFGNSSNDAKALSAEEKEYIAGHPAIRVAVIRNDAPYFSVDGAGKESGIIPDYFGMFTEYTGIKTDFVIFDTQDDAIEAIRQGDADLLGVYSSGILSAYNAGLRLTVPYMDASAMMITKSRTDISNVKTVAVKERYMGLIAEKRIFSDDVKLVGYANASECFEALKRNQVDALICGMPSATWMLNQTNSSAYGISPVSSITYEVCGALLPKNDTLCSLINKVNPRISGDMDGIVERNTLQENNWKTFISRIPPVMIVLISGIMMLLIIGLVWALVLLKRRQSEHTAVLAAQAEAEKQKLKMETVQKSADDRNIFFSNISHDMRTPLNAIIGFADLAGKEEVSDKAADYLAKIKLSGELLLGLINDTLTISKMSSGKFELHPEAVDSLELNDSITASISAAAREKNVEFTADIQGMRRRLILADKLNIQKIFLNLLSNAVKFTPPGGHVWYTVTDSINGSDDPDIVVTVKDDGIGMSEEYQRHMYEPFKQEQRTGYEAVGTGLGLSIVKQLVDLMDGSIKVKSEKNIGTTFIVRLHLPEVHNGSVQDDISENDHGDSILSGRKVLMCEDNELNREIACALLEARGIVTVTAVNGMEGLKLFSESSPGEFSLILMDLRMPVMDGYEATQAIRASGRHDSKTIPIIAMTADAFEDDVQKCLSIGMNGHISKPIDPNRLYRTMSSAIK